MKHAKRVLWLSDVSGRAAPRPRLSEEAWVVSDAHTESDAIATLSWGDVDLVVIEEPWNRGGTVLKHLMGSEDAPAVVRVGRGADLPPESRATDLPLYLLDQQPEGSWGATFERVLREHKLARFVARALRAEGGRMDASALLVGDIFRAATKPGQPLNLLFEGPRGKGWLNVLSGEDVELRYGAASGVDALFLAHLVPPSWVVSLAQPPSTRAGHFQRTSVPRMLEEFQLRWEAWTRLAPTMPSLDSMASALPGVQVPPIAAGCLKNPAALAENLMHVETQHLEILRAVSELHAAGKLVAAASVVSTPGAARNAVPYRRTQDAMPAMRVPPRPSETRVEEAAAKAAAPRSLAQSGAPVAATIAPAKVGKTLARGTLLGLGARGLGATTVSIPTVSLQDSDAAPAVGSEPAAMHTVSVPAPVPLRSLIRSEAPSSDEAPQTARSQHLAASLPPSDQPPPTKSPRDALRPTVSAPPKGSTPRLPPEEPSVVVQASLPPSARISNVAPSKDESASPQAAAPVSVRSEPPRATLPDVASTLSVAPIQEQARARASMSDTLVTKRSKPPGRARAVALGATLTLALVGAGVAWRLRQGRAVESAAVLAPAPSAAPALKAPEVAVPSPEVAEPVAEPLAKTLAADAGSTSVVDSRPLWTRRELEVALERGLERRVVEEGLRVVAQKPEDAVVWEMLGVAYKSLGKREESRAAFRACADHAKGPQRAECLAFSKK